MEHISTRLNEQKDICEIFRFLVKVFTDYFPEIGRTNC